MLHSIFRIIRTRKLHITEAPSIVGMQPVRGELYGLYGAIGGEDLVNVVAVHVEG